MQQGSRRTSASVIGKAQDLLKQTRRYTPKPTAKTTAKTTVTASTEGSELNAYLSQLSMKTSGKPTKKTAIIEGLSDVSFTTDDDNDEDNDKQPVLQSRFVKQSLSQTLTIGSSDKMPSHRTGRPTSGNLNKTLPSYSSSALDKAAAFTAKYGSKKKPAKNIADDLTAVRSGVSDLDENNQGSELKSSQTSKQTNEGLNNKNLLKIKNKVSTSTPKKKENMSAFHSVHRFSDSDDELHAFMMNLSPVTSPDIPPIRKQQSKLKTKNASSINVEDSVEKQIESPFSAKANKRVKEKENDWRPKAVATRQNKQTTPRKQTTPKSKQLSPSESIPSSIRTEDSNSVTEEIKTERSEPSINKFGLQTIDDLYMHSIDNLQTVDDFEMVGNLQTIDDLNLQTIEDLHSAYLSPKKAESYASDFETDKSDATEIQEDFKEDSITESIKGHGISKNKMSISESSSIGTQTHGSSVIPQDSKNKSNEEESYIYTEDFHSYSRKSGTDSDVEDIPLDSSRAEVYSQSFSSYSETRTLTITPRKGKEASRGPGVDVGTQVDGGDMQNQFNPYAKVPVFGPSISAGFMDPKLVTSHVITPEALDALTSYSPSVLAMNDLLRAQLLGTQTAIQHMQQIHQSLVGSVSEDYQYTTLEQTKQYIKMHRKSRLTMEDALKQVKEEMDESHR